MDPFESLVVGENGCTFKDVVDVFCNEVNSVTVLNNWTDFARELSIDSLQIEEWRRDRQLDKLTLKDILHKVIESWKREQGNGATLSQLLKHLEKMKLKNVADDVTSFFSKGNRMHEGEAIFMLTLPTKSKYYIQRTLITRSSIEEKVFSSTHRDIFVLHGIERYRLSQLAKKELTDTSSNQVGKRQLSVRFILLERFAHWGLLCGKTKKPIHLLRHHTGRFHWICTKGDISALQNATDEKIQKELSEDEFIQKIDTDLQFQANQPICISDSPGMGKSLLLASIGRQLQQRYPQRSIAFIVISEFVVKVRRLLPQFHNTKDAALEALLQILCENNSARRQLVQKIMTPQENPSTQVELMFDGFDEVLTENFELAHECLEIFQTNFSSTIRVWITTRPQHLHDVEKRFSVLGYNIQAFQEKHQIDFLTSFWNHQGTPLDGDNLQTFSKHCLSTLKMKLNKKDEDIAGIPLQCMMIAEVYKQDAHLFCDSRNERLENCPAVVPRIEVNSISDLFERIIEQKIEKFVRTHHQSEEIDNIWKLHMFLALKLVFPAHAHQFKDILAIGPELNLDYYVNTGILECRGSTTAEPVSFIHRTFAEYLVVRYFFLYEIAHITADSQTPSKTLSNFIFEHVLDCSVEKCKPFETTYYNCSFTHSVVCRFIDARLGSQTPEISPENCVSSTSTKYLKDVIYACIHSDFGNIFKFLGGLKYPEGFCINSILNSDYEIFMDAIKMGSLELLIFLLQNFEHRPLNAVEGYLPNVKSALHVAVRRGSYTIFEYILKEHHFKHLVQEDEKFQNLVYVLVKDTTHVDTGESKDRVQILTALCNLNREMINYCSGDKQQTPLLAPYVNIMLLKKLIDCRADLLHFEIYKNTILHKATYYLSSTEYYDLLQSIPVPSLSPLLEMRNCIGETSLHLIVKYGLATPAILNLIQSTGFDINTGGEGGRTCLFYTVEMANEDESLPTVKLLLEKGADYTRVGFNGESIVHYSAQKGRIDCLRFFLEEKNMNVNQINKLRETPIFHALRNHESALTTVQFLLEQRADYKLLNSNRQNVLHYSAEYRQLECLQLFLNLGGLNINQADNDGDTPLLCAPSQHKKYSVEMIKLLLGKDADHAISNKKGDNVLHRLAGIGRAECFGSFAGLSSLGVNARNCDKDTPLHLVVKNINNYYFIGDDFDSFLKNIEQLVSLGADVNSKNKNRKTPLGIYKDKYRQQILLPTLDLSIKLKQKDLTIRKHLKGKGQEIYKKKDNVK